MLSERLRPDIEAAPWVIEEVKKLEALAYTPKGFEWKDCLEQCEAELYELHAKLDDLDNLLTLALPYVECSAEASHLTDGFRKRGKNITDRLVDSIRKAIEVGDK